MHDWFCFSGPYGANHGIEQHQDAIDHAHDRLNEFKLKNDSFDNFEFCEPFFVHGNCLCISPGGQLYDRFAAIYTGAAHKCSTVLFYHKLLTIAMARLGPIVFQRSDTFGWFCVQGLLWCSLSDRTRKLHEKFAEDRWNPCYAPERSGL